eukprot:g50142.t1
MTPLLPFQSGEVGLYDEEIPTPERANTTSKLTDKLARKEPPSDAPAPTVSPEFIQGHHDPCMKATITFEDQIPPKAAFWRREDNTTLILPKNAINNVKKPNGWLTDDIIHACLADLEEEAPMHGPGRVCGPEDLKLGDQATRSKPLILIFDSLPSCTAGQKFDIPKMINAWSDNLHKVSFLKQDSTTGYIHVPVPEQEEGSGTCGLHTLFHMTRAASSPLGLQMGGIDRTDWDSKATELKHILPDLQSERKRLYQYLMGRAKRKKRIHRENDADAEKETISERKKKGARHGKTNATTTTGNIRDAAQ